MDKLTDIYTENFTIAEFLEELKKRGVISSYSEEELKNFTSFDTDIHDTITVTRGGVPVMEAIEVKAIQFMNDDFALIDNTQDVYEIKNQLGGERVVSQVGDFDGVFIERNAENGEVWAFTGTYPDWEKLAYRLR